MNKKALRVRIYATTDLSELGCLTAKQLVIEKVGVHVDCIPACLELCPDGGLVITDVVDLPVSSTGV